MENKNLTPIEHESDLNGYFEQFAKPTSEFRVGLEAEFLGVGREGKALPFFGNAGIEAVLNALAERFGYQKSIENGHVIGLNSPEMAVTLEPGGQLELSAPPVLNVFEIEDQIHAFFKQLKEVSKNFEGVRWLATGMHPFATLEEIEWVPKTRYNIMSEYMRDHGTQSHEMMKRTATNQLNVDYSSEENAMKNLRVALGITSIVTAMFANSSFSNGKPNGFISKRIDVWTHTDPARTGLIPQFLKPSKKFQDYVDYLLDMPMIFLIRNGKWLPAGEVSFREFIKEGIEEYRPTFSDFELHLSTAFPEVRLKSYLEVRGADCQAPDLIAAVAAFWKGILYNDAAGEAAWKLVEFASEPERLQLHQDVAREGLQAHFGGKKVLDYARELVDISCRSLKQQTTRDETRDECQFLDRIRERIIRPGKSPAEQVLEKWDGELRGDQESLLEYLSI